MGRSVRLFGWIKMGGQTGDMWVSHDPSQVVGVVFLFCHSSGVGGSRPGVYSVTLLGLLAHAELWASCLPLERPCVHAVSQ